MAVLLVLVGAVGLLLAWADKRFRPDHDTVIEAIERLLPQTQCAQCGFPGCRPYARAVADGAAINLCPPGGTDTHQALARLLGRELGNQPKVTAPVKAVIDEQRCIGCYLCVQACPVEAIVGAPQLMHTVLEAACTGCELCLPPCPVDCIELVAIASPPATDPAPRRRWPDQPAAACIRCGFCEDACPVELRPQELFWFNQHSDVQHDRSALDLQRCIECGLCNQVCPSNIDLLSYFYDGRQQLAARAQADRDAAAARDRFADHQSRMGARSLARTEKRRERIAARTQRDWQK